MKISIFGWLDRIPFWRDLPYPTKGALLRAFKSALSVAVGILLTAATSGVLIPAEWGPMMLIVITALLQSADKFLREREIEAELEQELTEEQKENVQDIISEG